LTYDPRIRPLSKGEIRGNQGEKDRGFFVSSVMDIHYIWKQAEERAPRTFRLTNARYLKETKKRKGGEKEEERGSDV